MNLVTTIKLYALAEKHKRILAEYNGAPNQFEPQPKNNVPSLKNRLKVPLDEEIQKQEEDLMPDKAKERKAAQHRRFGKMGGLQTW